MIHKPNKIHGNTSCTMKNTINCNEVKQWFGFEFLDEAIKNIKIDNLKILLSGERLVYRYTADVHIRGTNIGWIKGSMNRSNFEELMLDNYDFGEKLNKIFNRSYICFENMIYVVKPQIISEVEARLMEKSLTLHL